MDLAILVLAAASLVLLIFVVSRLGTLSRDGPEAPVDVDRIREEVTRVVREESGAVREELEKRISKLGEHVEEVARIARGLVEREPGRPVAEELEPVLREAVESLDARIAELASAVVERRVETVSQTVTRILGEKGFTEVRIVDEPITEGARTRVLVNAKRDGMPYKGSVHLEDARVVEHRLAPSYPMFP